jgi:hypothetical protein
MAAAVGAALQVYAAAGENEVGLWDVAGGRCLQVLRTLRSSSSVEAARRSLPAALSVPVVGTYQQARQQDLMSRAKQLGIGELQLPQGRQQG